MSWADEKLTERFYEWELRGRGWQLFDFPILLEPPFREFEGHFLPPSDVADDGSRHTAVSHFVESLRFGSQSKTTEADTLEEPEEREPVPFERGDVTEIAITLPPDAIVRREAFEEFFFTLSTCEEPIAFEIVAASDKIKIQFAT